MNKRMEEILEEYLEREGRPAYDSACSFHLYMAGETGCMSIFRFLHRCASCTQVHSCKLLEAIEGRRDRAKCELIYANEKVAEARDAAQEAWYNFRDAQRIYDDPENQAKREAMLKHKQEHEEKMRKQRKQRKR